MFELTVVRSKSEILLHSSANRMQYLLLCCLYCVLWKHPDLVQVTTLDFHLTLLGLNAVLSLLLSPLHKKKKTLDVSLFCMQSTQVYKLVLLNCWGNLTNCYV